MPIDWSEFVKIVGDGERFLLTSHVRPDCDALGSELALAGVLEALGKTVTIVNAHPTPPNIAFIDPRRRIRVLGEDAAVEDLLDAADVVIVLDTSSWAQLGTMGEVIRRTGARKLVLDHHVIGDDLGATDLKDTAAEATGRLVAEAAEALGVAIVPEVAAALFAAVATDTGWFRFPATAAATYRLAGRLIDAGAEPTAIYHSLYEQDTLGRVKLKGRILERFQSELNGRLVYSFVRKADFEETGALPSDTEDVINAGLGVATAEVAVILVEQLTGGFKISLRSRNRLDCSRVAAGFGGGGHKAAAGAFVEGTFQAARTAVLDAVRRAMQ